ncbi:outer membrane assembly lipoprotein YfiO [Pseudomonas sp. NFXW11]|uniref:outer membrane assembly lipoprotein YfiO n=1 Tax=Pseudomonas sp. NFXW11 TaxID=2819531 RepID=UPI003CFB9D4E
MRIRVFCALALTLGALCAGQAQASTDDSCVPAWKLYSNQLSYCNNLPFLSPSNDNRVNLRLLMADQGSLPLTLQALSEYELSLGYGPVPFRAYRLHPAEAAAPSEDAIPPVDQELDTRLQALGLQRESRQVAGDQFISGEGSRCRSNSDESALAFVEQLENAQLSQAERQALARSRVKMLGACSWQGDELSNLLPGNLSSPAAKDFARYLQAAGDFYNGRFSQAGEGFAALKENTQPWLAETAAYMGPRTLLNLSQQNAFDEWSMANLEHVDKAVLQQAEAGFNGYLQAYPHGLYAVSAKGLMRRVHWLTGNTQALAADYARDLTQAPDSPRNMSLEDLVDEVDAKLLGTPVENLQPPLLLAVQDLMRMRQDTSPPLTREALQQQKTLFATQPALFDYLQAAFTLYVEQNPAAVLKQLPSQLPAQLDYLSFSQQTLRGLAMQAQKDWKGAATLWEKLLPLAQQPPQREQLELALAFAYERSGQLAKVFAADSPIKTLQVRAMLLRQVASADVLRQQAHKGKSATERNTAAFILLYKDLSHGQYAAFAKDYEQLPHPLAEEKLGSSLGWPYVESPSLQVFLWDGKPSEYETSGYSCPNLIESVALLQRDPKAPAGQLCLGEFIRLNNLDGMPMDSPVDAQTLGGTQELFAGKFYSRLDRYQVVINNPKASRDDRAYALYRAINCFASSGHNRCGGPGVEPAVRKAWFRQLKTKLGDTQWSQSLRYYW